MGIDRRQLGDDAARLIGHDFAPAGAAGRGADASERAGDGGKGPAPRPYAARRRAITSGSNSSATGCSGWSSPICCGGGSRPNRKGTLTRRLTQLVRREALARVAGEIGLGRYLRLSPAEAAAGAARNPGILADVVEAVIAAIYLDGGLPPRSPLSSGTGRALSPRWKRRRRATRRRLLQEWAQGRGLPLPDYRLVESSGPDHAPQFTVAVAVKGHDEASATASSKRAAETAAAAVLLERLADSARPRRDAETSSQRDDGEPQD